MKDRPAKMINGIKIVGVINPAAEGCIIFLRGERIPCSEIDNSICTCPYRVGLSGMWLSEDQALPLLLTGDVK